MLAKLTPAANFIIFRTKFWRPKYQSFVLGLKFFDAKILYKKHACKMLIKLTAGEWVVCNKALRYKQNVDEIDGWGAGSMQLKN